MWVKFFSHHTLSATVCFVIFLLYVSSYYGHPIGQATIFCSCFFFLLDSFFFLACSQQSQIGYRPYFHTWCGLSAPLECMSECAARGSLKIQDAKSHQKIAIWAPSHNFVRLYLRTKAYIDNQKPTVKNSSIITKHLYLILTFRSHHEIFIRRSWYSVIPCLDATISCRIKKVVVGMTQLITALVSIHSSMTFLADMYSFLDPPGRTVLFSVGDRSLFPVGKNGQRWSQAMHLQEAHSYRPISYDIIDRFIVRRLQ